MTLLPVMCVRGHGHKLQVLMRCAGIQQEQSPWTCSISQEVSLPLEPGSRAVPSQHPLCTAVGLCHHCVSFTPCLAHSGYFTSFLMTEGMGRASLLRRKVKARVRFGVFGIALFLLVILLGQVSCLLFLCLE